MNESEIAIRVEGLGKMYRLGRELPKADSIFEQISNTIVSPFQWLREQIREPADDEVLWALRDVSFEVGRGEVVGFIGHNGAGKSTLLKLLSRITEPTTGHAEIHGRIAALLEVGTGMHPELTGRENIYMNGTVLGMRKLEIDTKFDEIVEFSGVARFLDTPVKRYSTGMRLRLGFAVAAHLEPEIIVIDEVLAVGDAAFQKKCIGKMSDIANEGRTVLFVSHQMDMIRALCERCILLAEGQVQLNGPTDAVIDAYYDSLEASGNASEFAVDEDKTLPIQIIKGRVINSDGNSCERFDVFDRITFEFEFAVNEPREGLMVNFEVKRNNSTLFFSFDSDVDADVVMRREVGHYKSHVEIPCPLLKPGHYSITPGTGIANSSKIQHLENALRFDVALLAQSSSLVSYAEKRPGLIAVPIKWKTR